MTEQIILNIVFYTMVVILSVCYYKCFKHVRKHRFDKAIIYTQGILYIHIIIILETAIEGRIFGIIMWTVGYFIILYARANLIKIKKHHDKMRDHFY